jgi:hypothetical protein
VIFKGKWENFFARIMDENKETLFRFTSFPHSILMKKIRHNNYNILIGMAER